MLIANDEPDILILTEVIPKAQLQPITLSRFIYSPWILYTC